jgi:multidrug efflux pump subunit AcrA (membrane-fusion protein)
VRIEAPEIAQVTSVAVKEGELVGAGQVLLTMSSAGLASRTAGLAAEKDRLENERARARSRGEADAAFRAEKRLGAVTAELSELETRHGRLALSSPIAGRVLTARPHDLEGRVVTRGTPLLVIGDCRTMTAEIPVTERLLTDLAAGEAVSARVRGRPLERLRGTVVSVAPATAASTTRSEDGKDAALRPPERPERFVALAEFDNADGRLLPRMTGVASIYGARASYLARSARVLRRWIQTIVW